MTDQELDRLMRQALLDAIKSDMEALDGTDAGFTPSARYQRQMAAMRRAPLKWARQKNRPLWKRVLRQAAMILLAASAGFGGVLTAVPSARAGVMQWWLEWHDTYVVYRYGEEAPEEALPEYELTWLPEGYEKSEILEYTDGMIFIYQNNDGDMIFFDYGFIYKSSATSVQIEHSNISNINVGNHEGLYYETIIPGTMNTMIWIDAEAGIQFQIDSILGKDDILHMAECSDLVKLDK